MSDSTIPAPTAGGRGDPEAIAKRRAASAAATEAVRAKFAHDLDVAYGPSPKNRYDIFMPNGDPAGSTLVFLHGGGFRSGSWSNGDSHGLPYLEEGGIYVSMGYPLIDEVRFPICAADAEAGLLAVRADVERRGGDPERIYLSGHSAGAMLAAQVALRPGRGFPADLVKGIVLISGVYDFTRQPEEVVDRGSDRYVADLCGAITHVPGHTITVAGDNDFPRAIDDAIRMADAITEAGGTVERFVEPNADHFGANRAFITPGGDVAYATSQMMGLN